MIRTLLARITLVTTASALYKTLDIYWPQR